MADIADITQAREELLENLRRKAREDFKAPMMDDCVECGTSIPEGRQKATGGTDMCIDCASLKEKPLYK